MPEQVGRLRLYRDDYIYFKKLHADKDFSNQKEMMSAVREKLEEINYYNGE